MVSKGTWRFKAGDAEELRGVRDDGGDGHVRPCLLDVEEVVVHRQDRSITDRGDGRIRGVGRLEGVEAVAAFVEVAQGNKGRIDYPLRGRKKGHRCREENTQRGTLESGYFFWIISPSLVPISPSLVPLLAEHKLPVHHPRNAVIVGDLMVFGGSQPGLAHPMQFIFPRDCCQSQ